MSTSLGAWLGLRAALDRLSGMALGSGYPKKIICMTVSAKLICHYSDQAVYSRSSRVPAWLQAALSLLTCWLTLH